MPIKGSESDVSSGPLYLIISHDLLTAMVEIEHQKVAYAKAKRRGGVGVFKPFKGISVIMPKYKQSILVNVPNLNILVMCLVESMHFGRSLRLQLSHTPCKNINAFMLGNIRALLSMKAQLKLCLHF